MSFQLDGERSQLEADLCHVDDLAQVQRLGITLAELQEQRKAGQDESELQQLVRLRIIHPAEARRREAATDQLEKLQSLFGQKSSAKLANALALSDPAEYKRLRIKAVQAGLILPSKGRR